MTPALLLALLLSVEPDYVTYTPHRGLQNEKPLSTTPGTCADSSHALGFNGTNLVCQALSGSGGAPTGATYITQTSDATLSAEQAMSTLGTGLVLNTTGTGVQSIYAGAACGANTVARSTNASGALTCSAIDLASADVTNTLSQARGGTGAGALTCSAGQCLTSNGSVYSCTSTITANDLVCSGTCVADAEIAAVSGAKVSGAVATATALASDPSDCSAGQYAIAIATSGNLSCAQVAYSELSGTPSAMTVTTIGSTPNANGATITGTVLNLEPASASFGGVLTTGTQTIAGDKSLTGVTTLSRYTTTSTTNPQWDCTGDNTCQWRNAITAATANETTPAFYLRPQNALDATDAVLRIFGTFSTYFFYSGDATIGNNLTIGSGSGNGWTTTDAPMTANDTTIVSNGTTWVGTTLPSCNSGSSALTYNTTSNAFGCNSIAGGSGNTLEATVALSGGSGFFSTTVTGQAWVTASSEIVCSVLATTSDGLTVEAISIAGLSLTVSDRVAGTGFNVNVFSPYGLDGTVRIHCSGA